jgi:hypothetical protein
MADSTVKILLLVIILVVLAYIYKQNSGTGIIGISGEPAEKAAEKIVNRDCSGTEYIVQKPCSRNGVVLDGLTDETSGAGFETHVLDKNHEGFVRQLGDGVCPPKLVECNVDPPKPCSGNTWLDALCVRLDADGNEVILEDGNADRCGDGILKQTLDTSAADYEPATKGGLCTFERSGTCQKTCPEPQPPVCNYPVLGWQYNDLGCVKSQDDLTPVGCGETGVIQRYKASTMNTEYCKNLTEWVSCTTQPCPQDCEGEWSDWTPNPDACDVQPSESRIYSITKPAVGNTQFGYGKPCEEIHDKVETRSRQDPIQPCCTQSHNWTGPIGGECSPRGTGIFVQTTEGQCADDIKSQVKPCCYEAGDWEDIDLTCLPTGKKRQKQTTTPACRPGTEIREVDCCYTTEWENVGSCNSNGEQPQSRIMAGSCTAVPTEENKELCDSELTRLKGITLKEEIDTDILAKLESNMDPVPDDLSIIPDFQWRKTIPACELTRVTDENFANRTVPCHYVGDWQAWGACNGQKMYRQRKVVNSHLIHPTHGTNTSTQEEKSCRNCKGEWRQEYESKHGRSHRRNRHKRADWQRFYKTQNESGGGHCSGLPEHGSYRKTDNYTPCGHINNEDGQCGFRYASWKWMEANYNNNAVVETVYSSG